MAINLGTLYQRLFNEVNKDQSGNTYTPAQLNNDLQYVQYKYLKLKYGLPEQPNGPQYYEVTQKIADDIVELKVWLGGPDKPLLRIDKNGRAVKPSDYWHPASIFYTRIVKDKCGESTEQYSSIDLVTEDQRPMRLLSPLMKPTAKNPIACVYDKFIQFYPLKNVFINFTYLRKPETPFFDFDIINDEVVFLPVGSVHSNGSVAPVGSPSRTVELSLPDDTYEDIVTIMLSEYGLAIRDQLPLQIAEQRKVSGF